MSRYIIEGGKRLTGEVEIHGAKNSALPILAAALLTGTSVIHNCPALSDVKAACRILSNLGCQIDQGDDYVKIDATTAKYNHIPDELIAEMRSSILFLGAILARFGQARISYPGGCELGPRPIDLHIAGLKQLGAVINEDFGYLDCKVEGRLKGAEIFLPLPSVGATENIILAACTAQGTTTIHNAAQEPEITDLIDFLNKCGADISTTRYNSVIINGVESLHSCEHRVIPDRIEAATYLCFAAITGGDVTLRGTNPQHLISVLPFFKEMGCNLEIGKDTIHIKAPKRLKNLSQVKTMPYPGFPTDAQSPLMAVATVADGTSIFVENIFQSRYKQVGELAKMGAVIRTEGRMAVVEGAEVLQGAVVNATDLRSGASLVAAALAAKGKTIVENIKHIDRGYYHLDKNLSKLGANIVREN